MRKRIRISYFPNILKFATPLFFGSSVYLFLRGNPFWGLAFILLGILILTTTYNTELDLKNRYYKDYLFLLGFKLSEKSKTFKNIDRIIITRGYHKHTVRFPRADPRVVSWSEFTAILLLDEADELELMTKKDKRKLILSLKDLVEFLKVGMEDRTGREHYWIDLSRVK